MHHHIFVAGTFDGLHAGHQRLLAEAFTRGGRVTIGLTSDAFVARYKSDQSTNENSLKNEKFKLKIRDYEERKQVLQRWVKAQGLEDRSAIIPISDPHEPAASMKDLDALIITRENRTTGERINALRQGLALSLLSLIEVSIVPAQDGKPISSTRLRNGEIDPDGRLVMPETLRVALGKPMGKILRGKAIDVSIRSHEHDFVMTVGDLSTKTVLDAGVMPRLAVIDGQVGRKPFPEMVHRFQPQKVSPFEARFVNSGPGFISREAIEVIQNCLTHSPIYSSTHHVIVVSGEEDLLVLPVIQYAPLGSFLYYGQPGEGLVEVKITKEIKKQAIAIIKQFLS